MGASPSEGLPDSFRNVRFEGAVNHDLAFLISNFDQLGILA